MIRLINKNKNLWKKVNPLALDSLQGRCWKTLIMMKLVILIISLTAFQVNAKLVLHKIYHFNMRNTEIKDVLKVIEKQSNYRFMYNYDSRVLNQK